MAETRMCVLYDRECNGCGECDRCDLDPEKICDNCMKCVNGDAAYRAIAVEDIELESEYEQKAMLQKHEGITDLAGRNQRV